MKAEDIKFVPWSGGECPVPDGHDVSLKFRVGITSRDCNPEKYFWGNNGDNTNIVGYFDHTEAERLTELFALAPAGATHIGTEDIDMPYLKHANGDEFFYFDGNEWAYWILIRYRINKPVEIPPRERELNNLADKNDEWHEGDDSYICDDGSFIDEQEWKARREQRIAAGLIYVNEADEPYPTWTDVPDDLKSAEEALPPEKFNRESRYWVFKRKNLTDKQEEILSRVAKQLHPAVVAECVVVESDWPCYKETWLSVERFAKGDYFDPYKKVAELNQELYRFKKGIDTTGDESDAEQAKQDSQQEWVNGLPMEGTKCEYRLYSIVHGETRYGRWYPCVIEKVLSGRLLIRRFHGIMGEDADPECRDGYQFVYTESNSQLVEFRPIQPEQKPDERDAMISDMAKVMFEAGANIGEPGAINDTTLGDLYDWLKSTGKLNQGGGDE